MWYDSTALLTLPPHSTLVLFLQSRYLTIAQEEDECDSSSLAQPLSEQPLCYPFSFLPFFLLLLHFLGSFLSLSHCRKSVGLSAEWRVLSVAEVVVLRKQLLTSHFPHPAPIIVIISTVSQHTPTCTHICVHTHLKVIVHPSAPPICGQEDCADRRIQHSLEMEGNTGRWRQ